MFLGFWLSWVILGPSWGYLGPSWAILGHLGAILGPSWDHFGAILAWLRATLGLSGAVFGPPPRYDISVSPYLDISVAPYLRISASRAHSGPILGPS